MMLPCSLGKHFFTLLGKRCIACDTFIRHDQSSTLASLSSHCHPLIPLIRSDSKRGSVYLPLEIQRNPFPFILLHPEQIPLIERCGQAQSLFTAPSSVADLGLLSTNVLITSIESSGSGI